MEKILMIFHQIDNCSSKRHFIKQDTCTLSVIKVEKNYYYYYHAHFHKYHQRIIDKQFGIKTWAKTYKKLPVNERVKIGEFWKSIILELMHNPKLSPLSGFVAKLSESDGLVSGDQGRI